MALWSGQGTLVTVAGSALVRVTDLQLRDMAVLADVTDCGSAGRKERLAVLGDAAFSMNVLFRDEQLPDVDLALAAGDTALIAFNMGNSAKNYDFVFIVENLTISLTKDDAIKWAIDGYAQGDLTRPFS